MNETNIPSRNGIVLHIPHSSRAIPSDLRTSIALSDTELDAELLRMTDSYTDELFQFTDAPRVVFPVSRIIVDPERFADDSQEPMAAKGMGAVYTMTSQGKALRKTDSWSREDLMRRFYNPHNEALTSAVAQTLKEVGECVVVDCHSFPSKPLPFEESQETERPQLCIGTDPYHTPDDLLDRVLAAAASESFSVRVNSPYRGALVPAPFYQSHGAVFAVMIEVNRCLYMDEATGEKLELFDEVRRKITAIVETIDAWRDKCFSKRLIENRKLIENRECDSD